MFYNYKKQFHKLEIICYNENNIIFKKEKRMKLTKQEAYKLLIEAEAISPGRYVEHSKRVGEAARKDC